jgi:putative DNA primase/helicase
MKAKKLVLDPQNVVECAEKFREHRRPQVWSPQVRWWWDYDERLHCYKEVMQATMQHDMQDFLVRADKRVRTPDGWATEPFNPFPSDVRTILESLQNEVHRTPEQAKPPAWLDDKHGDIDPHLILPVQNGLLNIKTRELLDHTPLFFCNYCLPLGYYPDQEAPELWLRCLNEWFGGRQHLTDALQEAFGYTLSTNRNMQRIFFLRGVKGSGKGTVMRVLSALCGQSQTASVPISILGEKYGLENCLDKLLLLITDMTLSDRKTTDLAAERLKAISGQDLCGVRRVGITSVPSVYLPGQFWIGANILPNFGDSADALNRRLLVWPFDYSFEGIEDFDLSERLTGPDMLAGILNWSLVGLDRLLERGKFAEWEESREAKRALLALSNPVAAFIEACCDLRGDAEVEKLVLYRAFSDFSAERGMTHMPDNTFAEKFREAVGAMGRMLGERRPRTADPKRSRPTLWRGIALNADCCARYYQQDEELVGLGMEGLEAVLRDANGFPIPKVAAGSDFEE